MQTANGYQARFAQLRARYEREHDSWDWSDFIDWLIARRATLRPASFRQYRAAVVWALQQQGGPQAGGFCERLLCEGQAARSGDLPTRTSARKAKSLSGADQRRLVVWLRTHHGPWDALVEEWLFWSIQTGLRPGEWRDASLCEHAAGVALQVRNAKRSHGRAHGEFRTVHLQINLEEGLALQVFLGRVQSDFAAAYQGCRLALHRATHALWPRRQRHPTLYTGRHQFVADAKVSGLAPEEIAALLGHAVTSTHQTHYGKRRCGRSGLLAAVDPGDVRRVQDRMQAKAGAVARRVVSPSPGLGG